jgi:hypothetical protein
LILDTVGGWVLEAFVRENVNPIDLTQPETPRR